MRHETQDGTPTVVPIETIRARLIQLAAAMVRGRNMPSEHGEDWPKMSAGAISRVLEDAKYATEQAREWGVELRTLADALAGGEE